MASLKAVSSEEIKKLLENQTIVLEKIIDQKMYDFYHEVNTPALERVVEMISESIKSSEERVGENMSRVERKLDNVTDMLADRITNHEKRITKLEVAIA